VEKMAADYVLRAVLLVKLTVMLADHRVFRWLQGQLPHRGATRDDTGRSSWAVNAETDDGYGDGEEEREMDGHSDADHHAHGSEYARYAGALTALVLLMYEGVTSATMDLLNCVPWDGALRLFRAATPGSMCAQTRGRRVTRNSSSGLRELCGAIRHALMVGGV
jgi:hypothetical protein